MNHDATHQRIFLQSSRLRPGARLAASIVVASAALSLAAWAQNVEPQTIANGNLLIPRAVRNIPIFLPQQHTPLDVILARLFAIVRVPFTLDPDTALCQEQIYTNGNHFGDVLELALPREWDCRIEKGVYIVFKRATTNVVPGHPDLDRHIFVRQTANLGVPLRPFLQSLFNEANLKYEVDPKCPETMPGVRLRCRFREALKTTLFLPGLTFQVRDGVYYIYPRPD